MYFCQILVYFVCFQMKYWFLVHKGGKRYIWNRKRTVCLLVDVNHIGNFILEEINLLVKLKTWSSEKLERHVIWIYPQTGQ